MFYAVRERSEAFQLDGLKRRILDCGAEHFDPRGTTPFSFVENLVIVGCWREAIEYLLRQHHLLSATHLSLVLYWYNVQPSLTRDLYITCVLRALPLLWSHLALCVAYCAVLREPAFRDDLLVVGFTAVLQRRWSSWAPARPPRWSARNSRKAIAGADCSASCSRARSCRSWRAQQRLSWR